MRHSIVQSKGEAGLVSAFSRRLRRYWNLALGRIVELTGNRIWTDGMVFSLDSPVIYREQKWILFSQPHEPHERMLLDRWLPRELALVEFGGGIGVVSCVSNRKLAKPEMHIVVEANPAPVPLVERNRDLNGCRYQVIHKALAYDAEAVRFEARPEYPWWAHG